MAGSVTGTGGKAKASSSVVGKDLVNDTDSLEGVWGGTSGCTMFVAGTRGLIGMDAAWHCGIVRKAYSIPNNNAKRKGLTETGLVQPNYTTNKYTMQLADGSREMRLPNSVKITEACNVERSRFECVSCM